MFIYIYGAGVYAKRCYEEVIKFGFIVKSFVVTDKTNNPQELFGIPVVGVDDFKLSKESILIIALKNDFRSEVKKTLKDKGINNFLFYPNVSNFDFPALVSLNSFVCKSSAYKFVYVYGAGVYGRSCLEYLHQRNVKVDGVLVTELESNPEKIDNIPVLKYDELTSPKEDSLILVALKPKFRDQVLPLLTNAGYKNFVVLKAGTCVTIVEKTFEDAWRRRHGFVLEPEAFGCITEIHDKQKKIKFQSNVKFSILMPLYNPREDFLREMIASVVGQSYEDWELCLDDSSDDEHSYVQTVCLDIAKKDKRIKYKKESENRGISENTNACVKMATGNYVGLMEQYDLLHPAALYEIMKVISSDNADFIYTDEATFKSPNLHEIIETNFKPDFAPDYFNGVNYIRHFTVFSRKLMNQVGYFKSEYDGAQDYDLFLRLTEKARCIRHISKCLYYCRECDCSTVASVSSNSNTSIAGQKALLAHYKRKGMSASVILGNVENTYRVKYEIRGEPLISILIPNNEHWETLKKCVESIIELSTYKNYEIIIIENNSKSTATFDYYKELEKIPNIRIVTWSGSFNYSSINNFGAKQANGEYLLLLNNDVEVITPGWIEEMLMYAQREDVGAVGAMLYYPSNKIQHAGVIVGIHGVADHSHKYYKRDGSPGYARRMAVPQNLSAVTAACVLIPKKVFYKVKGLDENFAVAFNDVDLCLRIRSFGYAIVWTPYAELFHHESESRGYEDTPEKKRREASEIYLFKERWSEFLAKGDPFYNKNLALNKVDFSIAGLQVLFHP